MCTCNLGIPSIFGEDFFEPPCIVIRPHCHYLMTKIANSENWNLAVFNLRFLFIFEANGGSSSAGGVFEATFKS